MSTFNLWTLFDYDELIINMRQKNDVLYAGILSRIRLGLITNEDIEILQKRNIKFSSTNSSEVVQELCKYLHTLPDDTVCLLPTRNMCDILNTSMMRTINSDEINLVANDSFKCPKNLQKKVLKMLDGDDNNICGIDRIITIKIGSKVMIRRNIDVSIGLVNGTIGKVVSICKEKDEITNVCILLKSGKEYSIPKLEYKFIVLDKIYVTRQQFPISNSYGITIHKSQGLSLENAVVEAGNSIFSNGQTYVALSRITKIEGLHLVNFDPSSCTADELAILEYNRLRAKYRPDLQSFILPQNKDSRIIKVRDVQWTISKNHQYICNSALNYLSSDCWDVKGLVNEDCVSCYANASVQSLFHSTTIRRVLLQCNFTDIVKTTFNQYISKSKVNIEALREFADVKFVLPQQQDVAEFLTYLCNKSTILQNIVQHNLSVIIRCPACDERNDPKFVPNYILSLCLPDDRKSSYTLQDIVDYNIGNWREIEGSCSNACKLKRLQKIDIVIKNTMIIFQLLLFSYDEEKMIKINNFKMKDVPKAKVCINKKYYKVHSGIFHNGNSLQYGHYTNMLRQNNHWLHVNDLCVEKKPWPKSAKNAYILLLEEIN